jgi:hypothetical protein
MQTKFEIIYFIKAMLKRPMMYAQTHESLEDQVCLLISMITEHWNEKNVLVASFLTKMGIPQSFCISEYINSHAPTETKEYKMKETAKLLNLCFGVYLETLLLQEEREMLKTDDELSKTS